MKKYFLLIALFAVPLLLFAQDSTAVIVGSIHDYFPAWVITILQTLTTGILGSYIALLISKKLYNGKVKFIATGLFLIVMGAGAAALAKIPLSNFPEFISFSFSAAIAAYNLWIKKR